MDTSSIVMLIISTIISRRVNDIIIFGLSGEEVLSQTDRVWV